MDNKAKWLVALFAGLLVGAGAGLVAEQTFDNHGTIATVGVSVDWMDGTPVTSVDWGAVENGTAYVLDPLNVTNTSNVNATLSLNTTNWSATIITLNLSWNYTGAVLAPGESVVVQLEQTVTATGDWSYTTVVKAESV